MLKNVLRTFLWQQQVLHGLISLLTQRSCLIYDEHAMWRRVLQGEGCALCVFDWSSR